MDLPDPKEVTRNTDIEEVQRTRNPFVDCPHLVDQISDF
jgi:endonuclease I